MDHRVSKDMISKGMSVTGEKKTEELGGSQYGSVATPSSLMDAYSSMYNTEEKVEEDAKYGYDSKGNSLNPKDKKKVKEETVSEVSFSIGSGGGSSSARQHKINKAADRGVPNAASKAKGALLPNIKLVNSYEPEEIKAKLIESGKFSEEEIEKIIKVDEGLVDTVKSFVGLAKNKDHKVSSKTPMGQAVTGIQKHRQRTNQGLELLNQETEVEGEQI